MNDFFSSENLSLLLRLFVAQALIFFLFIIDLVDYSIPISYMARPFFTVIIIYYWAIYRPNLLSPAYIFALGLIYDLILGYPVGIHAILFITAQWIISDQRLYFLGQSFLVTCLGFSLTGFLVLCAEWLFFSAMAGSFDGFENVFYKTIVSSFLFPLMTLLFNVIYRTLPPVSQKHLL